MNMNRTMKIATFSLVSPLWMGQTTWSLVLPRSTRYLTSRSRCNAAPPTDRVVNTDRLQGLNTCTSGTQAKRLLERELLSREGPSSLYKSITIPPGASAKGLSDGDLAIQTRLANRKYKIMELIELSGDRDIDRSALALLCLMVACTTTALVANQSLPGPEILRFLVVWILSFMPLAFVGYGLADSEQLQAVLVSLQRRIFPAYRRRMIQHEAGHFLMGHLLGWPVANYSTNAVKNAVAFFPLSDVDKGRDYASQLGFDASSTSTSVLENPTGSTSRDVPYFSPGGRGQALLERQSVFRQAKKSTDNPFLKLSARNDPTNSWPFRGFADSELDQLAVVSVAGVCAELLAFGNAEGGLADLSQLRQIFNSAETKMPEREMDNRIRFALGYTMSQLRRHLGALDALALVMEKEGSVAECVLAVESCENISGQDGVMGDYELRRRQAFRKEVASWVERVFLGGEKTIDTEEDRLVQGKGGGYRKETFRLTGDDPLYAALAVAMAFFAWASLGGLSLH